MSFPWPHRNLRPNAVQWTKTAVTQSEGLWLERSTVQEWNCGISYAPRALESTPVKPESLVLFAAVQSRDCGLKSFVP
jgi:hypothetical protein